MKEFKLKAFNTITKQLNDVVGFYSSGRGTYVSLKCGIGAPTRHKIEVLKIMRSTGLKDKDGVEIYEGYIVEITTSYIDLLGNKQHSSGNVVVCFDGFHFFPEIPNGLKNAFSSMYLAFGDDFENGIDNLSTFINCLTKGKVVGNIYENKELLGAEK